MLCGLTARSFLCRWLLLIKWCPIKGIITKCSTQLSNLSCWAGSWHGDKVGRRLRCVRFWWGPWRPRRRGGVWKQGGGEKSRSWSIPYWWLSLPLPSWLETIPPPPDRGHSSEYKMCQGFPMPPLMAGGRPGSPPSLWLQGPLL